MKPVLERALKEVEELRKKSKRLVSDKKLEKAYNEFAKLKEWEALCASDQSG